jgi:hypothetical protein
VHSPSRIIFIAGRSLTDPPGLKYSALAWISIPGISVVNVARRSKGVLPIKERSWLNIPSYKTPGKFPLMAFVS